MSYPLRHVFWTYQPRRCKYNNEGEDKSSNILRDKNYETLSQKFRQIMPKIFYAVDIKN